MLIPLGQGKENDFTFFKDKFTNLRNTLAQSLQRENCNSGYQRISVSKSPIPKVRPDPSKAHTLPLPVHPPPHTHLHTTRTHTGVSKLHEKIAPLATMYKKTTRPKNPKSKQAGKT